MFSLRRVVQRWLPDETLVMTKIGKSELVIWVTTSEGSLEDDRMPLQPYRVDRRGEKKYYAFDGRDIFETDLKMADFKNYIQEVSASNEVIATACVAVYFSDKNLTQSFTFYQGLLKKILEITDNIEFNVYLSSDRD